MPDSKTKKPTTSRQPKSETKVVSYLNKNVNMSPRKLRLMINRIKSLSPHQALTHLEFTNAKSARIIKKALNHLIKDATSNHKLQADSLAFDQLWANEGPKFKRMDKSHGARFAQGLIRKRHSRLFLSVKGILNGSKS